MNTKICLFLMFVFLIIMLLFYSFNIDSNVIILLGVIIILLLNDLIMKREHFHVPDKDNDTNMAAMDIAQNKLAGMIKKSNTEKIPSLIVKTSCAPSSIGQSVFYTDTTGDGDTNFKIPNVISDSLG